LALFRRQPRVASLRDPGAENVQAANVLVLRSYTAQFFVKAQGILSGELRDAAHAKNLKIAQHRRTDGNQIGKLTGIGGHKNSP
jgi:hypothetical protein